MKVSNIITLVYNYLYRRSISRVVKYIQMQFACDIHISSLPDSTTVPHACGIVIHKKTKIGENVRIYQNVTIGGRGDTSKGIPKIKHGVTIYAGAVVLGDVLVGENSTIGANAVVVNDVPPNSTVVGVPASELNCE
jgi:serine O-acetyltransferase